MTKLEFRSTLTRNLVGMELRPLEGDEAIEDDVNERRRLFDHLSMEEDTVAAEPGEVVVDGGRSAAEDPGYLTVGGAGDGVFEDLG